MTNSTGSFSFGVILGCFAAVEAAPFLARWLPPQARLVLLAAALAVMMTAIFPPWRAFYVGLGCGATGILLAHPRFTAGIEVGTAGAIVAVGAIVLGLAAYRIVETRRLRPLRGAAGALAVVSCYLAVILYAGFEAIGASFGVLSLIAWCGLLVCESAAWTPSGAAAEG
jgi:hypothetical protein